MTKREVLGLLKSLLASLIEAETPPPPILPPAVPPPAGHRPFITWDHELCCPEHQEQSFRITGPASRPDQGEWSEAKTAYISERFG
jgi:hypothetical protein